MRRISLRGAQVLAAAFPKCGIEKRIQMRPTAPTLNLPIHWNINAAEPQAAIFMKLPNVRPLLSP
jgi:hypothetical protein